MWKILFSIMVLVPLTKSLPQNPIDTNLQNQTVNNIMQKLPENMLDGPSKQLSLNDQRSCPICKCGIQGKKVKIVGGIQVEYAHKYPWMASLSGYDKKSQRDCGATLINDRYVVTAAHCIQVLMSSTARVRLYEHDLEKNEKNIFQFKIRRIVVHEDYSQNGSDNDIALIRLDIDGGVPMSDALLPICMPKEGHSYENHLGTATGWGKLKESEAITPLVLREVTVPILEKAQCKAYNFWITENEICAGLPEGGKDTCQGDSGGPLTVTNGTVHSLVGITSQGYGCGNPNSPGLYVKVTNYLDWIKENTLDACWCN